MDCYIVRVYRHFARKNGDQDEIAGLVERVGEQDNGKPFSSYKGLVQAMREEFSATPPLQQADDDTGSQKCEVHTLRRGSSR